MSEAPEEDVSGRLRAEDRRGRVFDHFHGDNLREEEELPPPNPEENWVDANEGKSYPWLIRGLSAVILIVFIGVIAYTMQKPDEPSRSRRQTPFDEPSFLDSASPEEIKREAERVIAGFMNAKNNLERCQFILEGEKRLFQIEEFYGRPGFDPPEGYGGRLKVEPYSLEGEALYVGLATSITAGKIWPFHLRPQNLGLLIDWEASVGYGDISWEQFIETKPNNPVKMRVYLTGILAPLDLGIEDENFRTFEVTVRGEESKSLISIERGTSIEKELAVIVPRSATHPINLLLRWDKNGNDQPRLEILQILHNFWVKPRGMKSMQ